jgi:hypothetical protein
MFELSLIEARIETELCVGEPHLADESCMVELRPLAKMRADKVRGAKRRVLEICIVVEVGADEGRPVVEFGMTEICLGAEPIVAKINSCPTPEIDVAEVRRRERPFGAPCIPNFRSGAGEREKAALRGRLRRALLLLVPGKNC